VDLFESMLKSSPYNYSMIANITYGDDTFEFGKPVIVQQRYRRRNPWMLAEEFNDKGLKRTCQKECPKTTDRQGQNPLYIRREYC
jgi:hypothetical protein